MQPGLDTAAIAPRPETLLERAVRRELARLDRVEPDHERRAEKRPGQVGRVEGRVRRS